MRTLDWREKKIGKEIGGYWSISVLPILAREIRPRERIFFFPYYDMLFCTDHRGAKIKSLVSILTGGLIS